MAISRIGSAAANTTSLTPSWSGAGAGEIELLWCFRTSAATVPTVPSGFVRLGSAAANTCAGFLAYRFCPTSANVATGTATGATQTILGRYRGVKGIGNVQVTTATGTSMSYSGLTAVQGANSWYIGCGGHRSAVNVDTAPSGMTNVVSIGSSTNKTSALHDTNGPVSSWSTTAATVGASSGNITITCELLADGGAWSINDSDNAASWSLNTLNKVATRIGAASHNGIRQFTSHSTGKWGFGFRHILFGDTFDMTFGFVPLTQSLTAWPDAGVTFTYDEDSFANAVYVDAGGGDTTIFPSGNSIEELSYGSCAIDLDAGLIWICHEQMTDWNNDPTADPNAGTGGIAYNTGKGSNLFIWHSTGNQGSSFAINTWDLNDVAPIWVLPANASDFQPWDNPAAHSALNPASRSPDVTLSNDNLTVTASSDVEGVRVTTSHNSGKKYYSVRYANMFYGITGICTAAASVTNSLPGYADSLGVAFGGGDPAAPGAHDWYVIQNTNGSGTGVLITAPFLDGNVVDCAVDFDNGDIWFRVDGGDWNGSPTADPATGTGGHAIPVALAGLSMFPFITGDTNAVAVWNGNPSSPPSGFATWDDTGGGGGYTLIASAGAFAVTGAAATLRLARKLTAAAGSFSVTGAAATLRWMRRFNAAAGSFTVTGASATLRLARKLTAAAGVITGAGAVASLRASRRMVAVAGAFVVTGAAATFQVASLGYTLVADVGSFAVAGGVASFKAARKLTAAGGSFTVSGAAAGLRATRKLAAAAGVLAVAGADAALKCTRKLTASAGTFVVAGAVVTFFRGRILIAAAGAVVVTGLAAALVAARKFIADAGAFEVGGNDAEFPIDRPVRWDPVPPVTENWSEPVSDTQLWNEQGPGASPWSEV